MKEPAYVHPSAVLDSHDIGCGTRIWAFVRMHEGVTVGEDCQLCDRSGLGKDVRVGDRVTIKEYAAIGEGTLIEDDVFVGPFVVVPNDTTPRSPRMDGVPEVARRYSDPENWLRPSRIRRGASIGTGSIIGPGLEIGAFSMIGMGSVVHKDVPPHRLVVGNPARAVGWVCFCGERLGRDDDSAPWSCPGCERSFEQTDAGLLRPR